MTCDCTEDQKFTGCECEGGWGYCCEHCDEDAEPPFNWDDFAATVNEAIALVKAKLLSALKDAVGYPQVPNKARSPMWWQLMTPPPEYLRIREERDYEDFRQFYGESPTRQITSHTITLELHKPTRYDGNGWRLLGQPEPKRWIIRSYMLTVPKIIPGAPKEQYLTHVLASQPPDFGWWMPTLKEPW